MKIVIESDDRPLITDFDPVTGRPLVNVVTGEPIAELAPAAKEAAPEAPLSEPVASVPSEPAA